MNTSSAGRAVVQLLTRSVASSKQFAFVFFLSFVCFGCLSKLHLCAVARLVNVANVNGETALHYAVRLLREDLVYLLLAAGADANVRGRDGRSLLDIAQREAAQVRAVCVYCVRMEILNPPKCVCRRVLWTFCNDRKRMRPSMASTMWRRWLSLMTMHVVKRAMFVRRATTRVSAISARP